MFIAALFILAGRWKQLVSINGWMDKGIVVHMYMTKYYSAIKRMKLAICNITDGTEGIILSETSQLEKHKYYKVSLICGI